MGSLSTMDMVEQNGVNDQTLLWHLQGNHYPPIPAYMLPVAKKAIANCNRGLYERKIRLPQQTTFRGARTAPTHEVIEHMHLDCFLDDNEEV